MGDRGNIAILYKTGDQGDQQYSLIYLYTHWGGSQLVEALQDALRRAAPDDEDELGRWSEPGYLARIIFDSLKGDDVDSVVGFGIAPYVLDNNHPILAVDAYRQEVFILPKGFRGPQPPGDLWQSRREAAALGPGQQQGPRRWSFAAFIAQDFGPPADKMKHN